MKNIVRNLLLISISLVFTFAGAEILLRIFVPVRNVGPSFTMHDPVYGKALKRNLSTTRTAPEFTMNLTTNSLGFRGPEPEEFPSHPVLFLGDSFTMGYGVSDGEEYPDLIRQALSGSHPGDAPAIINAGMGNNGNGRWIKFLRSEGASYEPQLVVMQLFANDFDDNVNERLFTLSPESELIELPVPARSGMRRIQELIEAVPGLANSYLIGLARQVVGSRAQPAPEPATAAPAPEPSVGDKDQLTYRLIEEAVALCDQHGWPTLALIVGIEGERFEELRQRLSSSGIRYIRFPSKAERPDLYYVVDGHWNAQGHAFAAELILNEIAHRGLAQLR